MREILEKLARGEISAEEAERLLGIFAIREIGGRIKLDVGRERRRGVPEVVLAEGKREEDLRELAFRVAREEGRIIISRARREQAEAIRRSLPEDLVLDGDEEIGFLVVRRKDFKIERTGGRIGILAAGTADIPVAREVELMASEMGCEVYSAYDVGVAGIHRLFSHLEEMRRRDVDVLVVVAGREGALASLVAALVDIPVVGVPTSTGWGFGGGGYGALAAMLQSCSLGLVVVNIDGGVAAGAAAALIARRAAGRKL